MKQCLSSPSECVGGVSGLQAEPLWSQSPGGRESVRDGRQEAGRAVEFLCHLCKKECAFWHTRHPH